LVVQVFPHILPVLDCFPFAGSLVISIVLAIMDKQVPLDSFATVYSLSDFRVRKVDRSDDGSVCWVNSKGLILSSFRDRV
jgi:hypothetical protein